MKKGLVYILIILSLLFINLNMVKADAIMYMECPDLKYFVYPSYYDSNAQKMQENYICGKNMNCPPMYTTVINGEGKPLFLEFDIFFDGTANGYIDKFNWTLSGGSTSYKRPFAIYPIMSQASNECWIKDEKNTYLSCWNTDYEEKDLLLVALNEKICPSYIIPSTWNDYAENEYSLFTSSYNASGSSLPGFGIKPIDSGYNLTFDSFSTVDYSGITDAYNFFYTFT